MHVSPTELWAGAILLVVGVPLFWSLLDPVEQ